MTSKKSAAALAVAITAVIALAGCSKADTSTDPAAASSSAAAAVWNPPKPTGITDIAWADLAQDPSLDLALNCQSLPVPMPDEEGLAAVQDPSVAPGSTLGEWTALFTYFNDFMAPLCANLPAASASPTGG